MGRGHIETGDNLKAELLVGPSQGVLHLLGGGAPGKDEPEITGPFRQRENLLALLGADRDLLDAKRPQGLLEPLLASFFAMTSKKS